MCLIRLVRSAVIGQSALYKTNSASAAHSGRDADVRLQIYKNREVKTKKNQCKLWRIHRFFQAIISVFKDLFLLYCVLMSRWSSIKPSGYRENTFVVKFDETVV